MFYKRFFPAILMMFLPVLLMAQVTTSNITGTAKTASGQALEGATVTAVHVPSGTVYTTVSRNGGVFNLPGLRVGGPYQVRIEYVGYAADTLNDITLALGEPYSINAILNESVNVTQGVTVRTTARRAAVEKTGAATTITSRQLSSLPTISRSITDFTRLTPQSKGNSFGGRDARFNNLQVDGANLNNNFGLSSDPLPGGGAQPISLDAYDEISVNIAPYDVRQSGFTGAGINAVTKSGTNTFHGTAYSYYRDETFNGARVGDQKITAQAQKNQVFGGSLGGPIIRNKLFFFINGEYEKGSRPGVPYSPTGGSGSGNVSSTTVDSLKKLSDFLRNTYGYETGPYDNFPNFQTKNRKLLAKIDWNISSVHKLTLKYSDFKGNNDQQLNATSVPNGGGFRVTGQTNPLSRLPNSRFSTKSASFANSNYGFQDIVKTATLELNSNFHGRMSNQFLATYTKVRATRTIPGGQPFPTIDIFNGEGSNYMSAGTDPYTNNNDVINNIWSIIDNYTYYAGKHTITAGGSFEHQRVGNMFMAGSASYYIYNSLNDFITSAPPVYYANTYSLVPGEDAVYSANLKISQLGIYAQDEFVPSNKWKITFGIRADVPIYGQQPLENPAITALALPDKNGNPTRYNTGEWPKNQVLLSPRVGFRWDVHGDKSLLVRGGTGIFTGRIPFVFLTNMPTNSGMYQANVKVTDPVQLTQYLFNPDPAAYRDKFPSTPATTVPPSSFVVIDRNFKFPQVFRTNLAADKNLGKGFILTLEALYTKDINAVKMRNTNLKSPNANFTGEDSRPYLSGSTADRYLYTYGDPTRPSAYTAIALENTKKGYSYSLTAQLAKNFSNGLFGSLAYTYTQSKEVTANPGSQATSAWNSNPNIGTSNDVELGYSQYAVPHRVVASVSYRKEYANHFASTLSIFYSGSAQNNYSYVINGDLNGDGNNQTDLMYIYKNGASVPFVDLTDRSGNVIATVAEQQAAYDQFINSSNYLKNHKGEYAERNAALLPWYNRLDARFLQDFYIKVGENKKRNTLQFSVDVLNLPNLLNRNWGVLKQYTVNNPLKSGEVVDGHPTYTMSQIGEGLATQAYQNTLSTLSTWGMQLGLRYTF